VLGLCLARFLYVQLYFKPGKRKSTPFYYEKGVLTKYVWRSEDYLQSMFGTNKIKFLRNRDPLLISITYKVCLGSTMLLTKYVWNLDFQNFRVGRIQKNLGEAEGPEGTPSLSRRREGSGGGLCISGDIIYE